MRQDSPPRSTAAPNTATTPDAALGDWIASLRAGLVQSCGALHLVALHAPGKAAPAPGYRTLAQAVAGGEAIVTEAASAEVPTLQIVNKGGLPILVLDGEEVVGGRQNRVVNSSLLVPPRCAFPLPVSCVEQGRWHQQAAAFAPGEAAFPTLRAAKAQHVSVAYARSGAPSADQGAVWHEISELQAREATASGTRAMRDTYVQRGELLAEAERSLTPADGAVGVVAVAGGHAFCADVFEHPATLIAYWGRLVRSYALEAASASLSSGSAGGAASAAQRLLERAVRADRTPFPSPGLGHDVRLAAPRVVGAGLIYGTAAVHTALFRRRSADPTSPVPNFSRPSRRAQRHGA